MCGRALGVACVWRVRARTNSQHIHLTMMALVLCWCAGRKLAEMRICYKLPYDAEQRKDTTTQPHVANDYCVMLRERTFASDLQFCGYVHGIVGFIYFIFHLLLHPHPALSTRLCGTGARAL